MELVFESNPVLRRKAVPFDFSQNDPERMFNDLTRVMTRWNGLGIAAPQIGVSQRVFVIRGRGFFNPEIVSSSPTVRTEIEGCLSIPNLRVKVKRADTIRVRYQTILGDTVEHDLTEMDATCFQHERDHLDGILITDRVSKLVLDMARKRAAKR